MHFIQYSAHTNTVFMSPKTQSAFPLFILCSTMQYHGALLSKCPINQLINNFLKKKNSCTFLKSFPNDISFDFFFFKNIPLCKVHINDFIFIRTLNNPQEEECANLYFSLTFMENQAIQAIYS